jgi:hypothetical protein
MQESGGDQMPVWFLVVLLLVLLFAVGLAVAMRASRGSADGQNTTIVEKN